MARDLPLRKVQPHAILMNHWPAVIRALRRYCGSGTQTSQVRYRPDGVTLREVHGCLIAVSSGAAGFAPLAHTP
jgi:hypothetical protein